MKWPTYENALKFAQFYIFLKFIFISYEYANYYTFWMVSALLLLSNFDTIILTLFAASMAMRLAVSRLSLLAAEVAWMTLLISAAKLLLLLFSVDKLSKFCTAIFTMAAFFAAICKGEKKYRKLIGTKTLSFMFCFNSF